MDAQQSAADDIQPRSPLPAQLLADRLNTSRWRLRLRWSSCPPDHAAIAFAADSRDFFRIDGDTLRGNRTRVASADPDALVFAAERAHELGMLRRGRIHPTECVFCENDATTAPAHPKAAAPA